MSIFKNKIPIAILFDLLDKVNSRQEIYYLLNKSIFKCIQLGNFLPAFYKECFNYYKPKKTKYLKQPFTYKSFLTVVRQICNANKIHFEYKIKYIHSKYEIIYHIYIDPGLKLPNPDGTFQNETQPEDSLEEANKICF